MAGGVRLVGRRIKRSSDVEGRRNEGRFLLPMRLGPLNATAASALARQHPALRRIRRPRYSDQPAACVIAGVTLRQIEGRVRGPLLHGSTVTSDHVDRTGAELQCDSISTAALSISGGISTTSAPRAVRHRSDFRTSWKSADHDQPSGRVVPARRRPFYHGLRVRAHLCATPFPATALRSDPTDLDAASSGRDPRSPRRGKSARWPGTTSGRRPGWTKIRGGAGTRHQTADTFEIGFPGATDLKPGRGAADTSIEQALASAAPRSGPDLPDHLTI